MKTYVVIWKDELGCPRAWGQADNEEQAKAEAAIQLTEYRKGRPDLRGPWTMETKTLRKECLCNHRRHLRKQRQNRAMA